MTAEYTPGPWEVYVEQVRKADSGHPVIARTTVYRPSRYTGREIHEAERDANARLIAAAPALLEAAQAALTWWSNPDNILIHEPDWVGAVRQAIQQATGGK